MKHAFGAVLVAFLVLLLPAAQAFSDPDTSTLVVGVSSDVHLLDPAVSMDNLDWREIYPCYDRLVRYKIVGGQGSTEVEPQAAESWKVSSNGLVWTFKIRKGIRFDDGTPLDAKAVKFSFERVQAIGKGPADNMAAIGSIDVLDPFTVRFTLKNPYGPFLQTLAVDGASIVNPSVMKHEKDKDLAQAWLTENTDGSGPYKITEWKRGERLVLQSKPSYWAGKPKLKTVIIRFMRESSDQLLALQKGDIDIAEGVLIDQLPALQKDPNIAVRKYPSQFVQYVYLNNKAPSLGNKLVRQALNYAVDYQGIIDNVLQGLGVQMRGPIPNGMWGYNPTAFQYTHDVEKAKQLLQQAGVSGLTLTLIYSDRQPAWEQIATIMQANFADIGVTLKLQLLDNPTLRDKVDRGDFELCLGVWSPDYADPSMFMNFWFDSKNFGLAGNRAFYKNDAVDDLVRKAVAMSDQKERTALYRQAMDTILDEAPYIYLYQNQTVVPMRKSVKGYAYNPMLENMYNFELMSKE